MKTPQKLGLIAVVIFVISYFLPAYSNISGFACFTGCWNIFWGQGADILSGGWFYYSGFVISNVLFVVLVAALFTTKKHRGLRSGISIVCFLQILSWLALHLLPPRQMIGEIKIGYYVWLIAYAILVAAHFRTKPIGSPEAIAVAHSVQ